MEEALNVLIERINKDYNEDKYSEYCEKIINELINHFYKFEKILKNIKL